ncbi:YdbL family protein [Parvularcula sp. LCG005]|uniref:YdbL family protein n=1 Tax=Parvularcula sp. LCG005 TaxID=3078805 RepID=UPI0029438855|nr:YdbL family protein [Parvularcula sp. LCG005]WOI52499.1 YdbL family protein [Parvularcula sp. LCG005]
MKKYRLLKAMLVLPMALFATHVVAAPAIIEQAKSDCVVGERIDGYLGVIDDKAASDALRRSVREINQKRSAAYDSLASRNGVTPAIAAAATAEELINSAPSGHCVQNEKQEWVLVP